MRTLILLLLIAIAPARTRGATAELPLKGYCRVGKFFPATVFAGKAQGQGVVPVSARGERVVPVLVLSPAPDLNVDGEPVEPALRVLGENERIVGLVGGVTEAPPGIFGKDKQIITIGIDRGIQGPAVAWETLDAIACDRAPTQETLRVLLGGGAMVWVRAERRPDEQWPWQRRGDWWVLSHEPFGPKSVILESAYAPVTGWTPGATRGVGGRVVVLAVMISLGMLGATLPRRERWFVAVMLALALGSTALLTAWGRRMPALRQAEGVIAAVDRGLIQHDFWSYSVATRDTRIDVRSNGSVRLMLASAEQAAKQEIRLDVDETGAIVWTARLKRGEKLAWLTRDVRPAPRASAPYSTNVTSPMMELVRDAYLGPGVRVTGQGYPRRDVEEGFAEVFLERER